MKFEVGMEVMISSPIGNAMGYQRGEIVSETNTLWRVETKSGVRRFIKTSRLEYGTSADWWG